MDTLAPGSGHLDFSAYVTRESAGGQVEAARKLNETWSAFAQGWLGYTPATRSVDYGAAGGLRARW